MSFFEDHKRSIFISLVVYVVLSLSLIVGGGYALYSYRAELFRFFAEEYLKKETSKTEVISLISTEDMVVDLVEKANPAVVSIIASKEVPVYEEYVENINPFDFFGFQFQVPRLREKGTEEKEVGGGSGFIVSSDGYVVTNKHVIADTKATYTVVTNGGDTYDVKVIATDPFLDIAVLKIETDKEIVFPHLFFTTSKELKLGQTVVAIGNALGEFKNSVSVGVISGLARSVVAGNVNGENELLEEVIQTDAAINPGNSGGPLLNTKGEVIGVNVAVALGSENIGFALPSDSVRSVVESVKQYGEIVRPYVGIRYTQIDEALKKANDLDVEYGVLLVKGDSKEELAVIPGSPADKAGLVENDIILEFNGTRLDGKRSLGSLIREHSVGDRVILRVLHRGEEKTVELVLEKLPKDL